MTCGRIPTRRAYCSAHMGMAVMDIGKDLLVNAWYTGGVDVINFTNPEKLKEIAWYDITGAAWRRLGQLVRLPLRRA